jgi:hypothetical protein
MMAVLETHQVDESLTSKLRCLIFLPIISQTYCDPNSFAWKNEFLAFEKQSGEDAFGLKIKLLNGNVASRMLPIRIHELDVGDRRLLENEIGPLRSIDFVYQSPGVNRPLAPANVIYNELLTKSKLSYVSPACLAIASVALGKYDEAIRHARTGL